MNALQVTFLSLVFIFMSFSVARADEIQVPSEKVSVEQAAADRVATEQGDAGSDRSADSKSLFEGRCQMCHQLPEPTMLKPKQWKLILTTMQQRMQQAGVPPLTEEETNMILEYIASQS